MSGTLIGTVTHYYDRIGVAVIALQGTIKVGNNVHIFGRSTDFRQEVHSLQIEHEPIHQAGQGQEVALKVIQRARPRDKVYLIAAED
jgi:translation initiation factor IF-2